MPDVRELASARSFWKRSMNRAGRRSRYVEVKEMSFGEVSAEAVEMGLVDEVVAILGTGKEADVYLGRWKDAYLVLKVYRLHRTPHKKRGAIGYSVDIMGDIAAREFTILQKAFRAGAPVPTPARRVDNMFTMRYLGDEARGPQLKDVILKNPEDAFLQALRIIEKLLDTHIVHGDLSKYNLIMTDGRLFAIDFPQAIDFSSNMGRHVKIQEAKPLLRRDLGNIADYFEQYGVRTDIEAEYSRLLSRIED